MKPVAHLALAAAATAATFYVAAFGRNSLPLGHYDNSPAFDRLYAMAVIALTGFVAWFVMRKLRRRSPWALPRLPRWAWALIFAAYGVTWVVGVPAVQTHSQELAVDWWHRNRRAGYEASDTPSATLVAGLPIVPGLILTYQEFAVGPLDGWGGWTLHLWYGWGVAPIWELSLWIA